MDLLRIDELLQPFLAAQDFASRAAGGPQPSPVPASGILSPRQLQSISTYIDLILRWNARINLSAIRQPEQIVTRHFGESLFAARHLFPPPSDQSRASDQAHLIDIGSGAGFPGLPVKIWAPEIHLTLIESNYKKAIFLREVVRALALTNVDVVAGRAEQFETAAEAVILRAVEHFAQILPVAARLVAPGGQLVLLIGGMQVGSLGDLARNFNWESPIPIPLSANRKILRGTRRLC
jgi:16S rRNA (guanine527-N7)-methyltransferase